MTVQRVRQLFGKDVINLTDAQIQEQISQDKNAMRAFLHFIMKNSKDKKSLTDNKKR